MNFYEILILIIAGAIAIRFTFKFDLNKHLENRRKIKINQLKNICPHARIVEDGEKLGVESLFSKPMGTFQWGCSQCGAIINSGEEAERMVKIYLENPNILSKKRKEFIKQARKLKII